MAIFRIENEDLVAFARFHHKLIDTCGYVGFDQEDYKSIVGEGTTEYFFARGDSPASATKTMCAKLETVCGAGTAFVGLELPQSVADVTLIDEMLDRLTARIDTEQLYFNYYLADTDEFCVHLFLNNRGERDGENDHSCSE